MPRLSELLSVSPPLTNNISKAQLYQWISKADQGFQEGEEVEISIIKDIIQGSKGDVILVVPRRWFIITNLSFEKLLTAVRPFLSKMHPNYTLNIKVQVIKDVPERKYVLCRLLKGEIKGQYTDNETRTETLEKLDDVKIDGVCFTKTKVLKKTLQITKQVTISITPDNIQETEIIISEKEISSEEQEHTEYKIIDESTRLASLLSRVELLRENREQYSGYIDFWMMNGSYIVAGQMVYNPKLTVYRIDLPSEDLLKELSKYYVITIPKCYIDDTVRQSIYSDLSTIRRTLYEVDVYYNGEKKTIILKGLEIPMPLRLGIRRRRYGISQYARKTLPYGKIWPTDENASKLTKALSEFTEEAQRLYNLIKDRTLSTGKVSPRELFEDIFFIRTPKRKMKHLDAYIKIYDEVKEYAEKAILYLIFYGQSNEFRRFFPNYRAFRFQDGRITVDNAPPVPITSITLKGGEFEKRYREVYNLDNIILYHYARTDEKLTIIREEIKEIRTMLKEQNIDPRKVSFKELLQILKELSQMEEYPRNIILSFIRYATNDQISKDWTADWKVEVQSALELTAGLIRSGKPEDYTEERLSRLLRVLRVATLYIMKERGYSPILGVIFSGSPEEIIRKILEFIERLEGRMLALMMELRKEQKEEKVETPLLALSSRVKALMENL